MSCTIFTCTFPLLAGAVAKLVILAAASRRPRRWKCAEKVVIEQIASTLPTRGVTFGKSSSDVHPTSKEKFCFRPKFVQNMS